MAYDIFISYAHEDRDLRDKLAKHLSILQNLGLINLWYDGDIIAGTEWEKQIMHHLRTDKIILLLISADFMASKFCYSTELKEAIKRHEANDARVIPIILRPTYWKGAAFDRLQMLPTDGKAITLWSPPDSAFVNVIEGIQKAIEELQQVHP